MVVMIETDKVIYTFKQVKSFKTNIKSVSIKVSDKVAELEHRIFDDIIRIELIYDQEECEMFDKCMKNNPDIISKEDKFALWEDLRINGKL